MNLNTCDAGHQDVCFEGRECPVCRVEAEKAELQREIEDLEKRLEEALSESE